MHMHIILYVCMYVMDDPFSKWREFEGGFYWGDFPESAATFQGW